MITLYDYELSGNCYKVRLLLRLLEVPHSLHGIDFDPGREHKSPWFLELNPLGQLPVLQDGELVLRDAQAILVYLASRYDATGCWYPRESPSQLGLIGMWLSFANQISATAGAARLQSAMFYPGDAATARAGAHALFRILDQQLWFSEQASSDWLCGGEYPSIADIACFPYVMLSEEAGIARRNYPAIRRWCDRIRLLPGFIPMAGILAQNL
jgi:glutathione S-transferase